MTPEKQVEHDILDYGISLGWYLSVVDSKAVYNQKAKRYIKGMAKKGFPDIVGVDTNGLFLAIELKAKNKTKTATKEQLLFLEEVKKRGGFGVVVDSAELLHNLYIQFIKQRFV